MTDPSPARSMGRDRSRIEDRFASDRVHHPQGSRSSTRDQLLNIPQQKDNNMIPYRILHNLDAGFFRPYEPGDRLADGFAGQVPNFDLRDIDKVLEGFFLLHNHPDRPCGPDAPSISIGDVIIIGESAFSVASRGWKEVSVAHDDLLDTPWSEASEILIIEQEMRYRSERSR